MPCVTTSLSGKYGKVEGVVGVTAATEIKAFTLNLYVNIVDVTSWSSNQWKEILYGKKGGTGTMTAVGWFFPAQSSVGARFFTRKEGGLSVTGTILIGKTNIICEVDGLITYDCEFEFCGPITFDYT